VVAAGGIAIKPHDVVMIALYGAKEKDNSEIGCLSEE